MEYKSKTQIYQKVKKPLLERQRRARINKCLEALRRMMTDFSSDTNMQRMDKAEMLETTILYLRARDAHASEPSTAAMDSFKQGYVNAVNEVSRVLAATPGMSVDMGKSMMIHLGRVYNQLQQQYQQQQQEQMRKNEQQHAALTIDWAPTSPASSGYHSGCDSPAMSPVAYVQKVWRPWCTYAVVADRRRDCLLE